MQISIRNLDRSVRIVVGLALLSLPFWLDSLWRWWGLIGTKPLFTGLAGRCPGYRPPSTGPENLYFAQTAVGLP
jgi:hypothetical protein